MTDAEQKKMLDETGGVAFAGTALAGTSGTGKVTITKKTETTVEGSVDFDPGGGGVHTIVSFVAPICPSIEVSSSQATKYVCCDAIPQGDAARH